MITCIQRTLTACILSLIFFILFIYLPSWYLSIALCGVLIYILFIEWPRFITSDLWWLWLLTPFYPVLPILLCIALNQHPTYHHLFGLLCLLVASFDTGSYICGSFIGRHTIAPRISPGKTWEGACGGYLVTNISLLLIIWHQQYVIPWWFFFLFTLILSICGLGGDLFESWLKRRAQLKDSGTILPGHGGLLDRFDGILCTVLFFYLCKDYLILFFKSHV